MNFDGTFVRDVMRVIDGFGMTGAEADALCARLGSREEFVAWLLLRGNLPAKHLKVGDALVSVSASVVVSAATPRTERNFPIFEHQAGLAIETAMKSLIEASNSLQSDATSLQGQLDSLASHRGRSDLIRDSLGSTTKQSEQ